MTDIRSSGVRTVRLRRWAARLLSILWAYWAVFWTWFVFAHFYEDASLGLTVFIGIVEGALILLLLGTPILASVWQIEELGGRLLKIIGALFGTLVIVVFAVFVVGGKTIPPWWPLVIVALFTVVLPPLVSGFLFVGCHRRSQARS